MAPTHTVIQSIDRDGAASQFCVGALNMSVGTVSFTMFVGGPLKASTFVTRVPNLMKPTVPKIDPDIYFVTDRKKKT